MLEGLDPTSADDVDSEIRLSFFATPNQEVGFSSFLVRDDVDAGLPQGTESASVRLNQANLEPCLKPRGKRVNRIAHDPFREWCRSTLEVSDPCAFVKPLGVR